MDNPETGNTGHTRHGTNTTQKTKKMNNTEPTKNLGKIPVIAKSKQFQIVRP
jgi:hypothetical protein